MTQTLRYATFAALALVVNAMVFLSPASGKVRTALFFDCAITVPLCYWLLLVRPGLLGKSLCGEASLALIAAVSLMRGAYMLNSRAATIAGIVAEVALVGFVVTQGKRIKDVLPSATLARIACAELDVYRYAFGRTKPAALPEGTRTFTIHEASGATSLFWMLAFLTPFEAAAMHFLLPTKLASILMALSIYGAIWMIAVARSFRALPILVDSQSVTLRRGMLASLKVPRTSIASVSGEKRKTFARFAVLAEPTVWIAFDKPLPMELPMGFSRQVRGAAIAPDDLNGFLNALNES